MPELATWDSFYVIVGAAAGALIGLQFVVVTLIAERPRLREPSAGAAFATPNIVHFSTVLLLSALPRVPWRSITLPAILWGVVGAAGLAYTGVVARQIRTQTLYQPQFEEWMFHALLPLAGYATLAVSAFTAVFRAPETLFAVGAAALLLLFV